MYEKGLVTGSGKKLSPSMLYAMLKNRLYLGEIHWQNIHVIDGNANRDLNNQKNACEAKLRVSEESLLDQTLPKDRYNRIATDLNSMLGKLNEKLGALKKAKDVDLDRAEEVMSFTKNIYANYMSLEEGLQKRILDFFFDGFEVVDGVIIKERYRPLFQELVRENLAYIENPKRKTAFVSKGGDAVNVDDELGQYFNFIITVLEDSEYMNGLYSKMTFFRAIQEKEISISQG